MMTGAIPMTPNVSVPVPVGIICIAVVMSRSIIELSLSINKLILVSG